jgi:hypothetical protein
MAAVLHLLKGGDAGLSRTVVEQQLRAGDTVTVGLLAGAAPPPDFPPGVRLRRIPEDLSYAELLDLIFAADHVVTW